MVSLFLVLNKPRGDNMAKFCCHCGKEGIIDDDLVCFCGHLICENCEIEQLELNEKYRREWDEKQAAGDNGKVAGVLRCDPYKEVCDGSFDPNKLYFYYNKNIGIRETDEEARERRFILAESLRAVGEFVICEDVD